MKYLKYKIQNTFKKVFEIPKYQILSPEYFKYQISNMYFKYFLKYKILTKTHEHIFKIFFNNNTFIAAICAVVEILILKCCKATWRHRSREHSTCTMWFSICVLLTPTRYLDLFLSLKYIQIATLTLRVTWHYRSRDHTVRYIRFPLGALLERTQIWTS